MGKGFLRVLLLCAAIGGASSSFATERNVGSYDWSGVYLGATVGHGWGNYDQYVYSAGHYGVNTQGFVGGATLGYNYQIDPIVFGLEADFQGSGIRGSHASANGWTCTYARCRDGVASNPVVSVLDKNVFGYALGG